ncbi:cation transporter [Bradyrhizobium sp. CCBAU 51745]|uniref:cation transporter n=1 Tax=Bradyrhizobium sp. CCBAU 51745 TaxID=1325099 RepID=UPI002306197A|nr:cation transporter [Bradyrhizobium sp. CCBAU 51745]
MTGSNATTTRLRVQGMDCASCALKIENALNRVPGVRSVDVSVARGTVTVSHDQTDAAEMASRISALGYTVAEGEKTHAPIDHQKGSAPGPQDRTDSNRGGRAADRRWWQTGKARLTVASGAALAVAFAVGKSIPAIERWAFLLAMMVGLVPIARRAFSAAVAGTPFSIETLMTIAAVGAVFIGATEEAATVVLLFLIGELLEGVAAMAEATCCVRVLAPASGKVLAIVQDSEATVLPGTAEVVADLLSTDAVQIKVGAPVRIDGWGGQSIKGKVGPGGPRRLPEGLRPRNRGAAGPGDNGLRGPARAMRLLGHVSRVVVHVTTWSAPDALPCVQERRPVGCFRRRERPRQTGHPRPPKQPSGRAALRVGR